MSKHTPLPWVAGLDVPEAANNDPDVRYIWRESIIIASTHSNWIRNEQQEANAEFIVRACNSHYELVDALEAAHRRICSDICGSIHVGECIRAREILRRAKGRHEPTLA